ncbi:MAG: hypothetical protein Q8T03_13300 [Bacteroidota bacterium]|nr:hypothetical protein [Bacteroidota bacterium]MDP3558342.1 hypothetical protein [Bacteroidota bacterium]
MKTHVLKINDSTTFKELGMFIFENKVITGDEIVLEINVSYSFDFIFRRVLFLILREGISNNLKYSQLKPLPASKYEDTHFFDDATLSKALSEEADVNVIFK